MKPCKLPGRAVLRYFTLAALFAAAVLSSCKRDPYTYALISTNYGDIKVMLYNSTPKHRDNFIKLAREGFYDSLLFHRIIPNFMIQGGDPDSRTATPDQILGMGDVGYTIEPEIGAPHLRGTLAAAQKRDSNKRSSGCQFFIVTGDKVTNDILDNFERQKGIRYNPEQRQLYTEIGGAPWLDNDFTVFGEVVKGMEVVDKIAQAPVSLRDRPKEDIVIKNIRILKR